MLVQDRNKKHTQKTYFCLLMLNKMNVNDVMEPLHSQWKLCQLVAIQVDIYTTKNTHTHTLSHSKEKKQIEAAATTAKKTVKQEWFGTKEY